MLAPPTAFTVRSLRSPQNRSACVSERGRRDGARRGAVRPPVRRSARERRQVASVTSAMLCSASAAQALRFLALWCAEWQRARSVRTRRDVTVTCCCWNTVPGYGASNSGIGIQETVKVPYMYTCCTSVPYMFEPRGVSHTISPLKSEFAFYKLVLIPFIQKSKYTSLYATTQYQPEGWTGYSTTVVCTHLVQASPSPVSPSLMCCTISQRLHRCSSQHIVDPFHNYDP